MPPPPPPPPPAILPGPRPPLLVPQETSLKIKQFDLPISTDDVYKRDFREKLIKIIEKDLQTTNQKRIYLSIESDASVILQNGPQCGIIALGMAHTMIGHERIDIDNLMKKAIEKGYSLQGEMFSAFSMSKLAEQVYNCKTELLDMKTNSSKEQLLQHLIQGCPVLVPYDADFNHEPCKKKGHKSHWALLTGVLIPFESEKNIKPTKAKTENGKKSFIKEKSTDMSERKLVSNIIIEEPEEKHLTLPVEDVGLYTGHFKSETDKKIESDFDKTVPAFDLMISSPQLEEGKSKTHTEAVTEKQNGTNVAATLTDTELPFINDVFAIHPRDINIVNSDAALTLPDNSVALPLTNSDLTVHLKDTDVELPKTDTESFQVEKTSFSDTGVDLPLTSSDIETLEEEGAISPVMDIIISATSEKNKTDKLDGNIFANCKKFINNTEDTGMLFPDILECESSNIETDYTSPLSDIDAVTSSSQRKNSEESSSNIKLVTTPVQDTDIKPSVAFLEINQLSVNKQNAEKVSPLYDIGFQSASSNRNGTLSVPVQNSDITSPLLDTVLTTASDEANVNMIGGSRVERVNIIGSNEGKDLIGENKICHVIGSMNHTTESKTVENYIYRKSTCLNKTEEKTRTTDVTDSSFLEEVTVPMEDLHLEVLKNNSKENEKATDFQQHLEQILENIFPQDGLKFGWLTQDSDIKHLFHINPDKCHMQDVNLHQPEVDSVYVYARQGKSPRQAIWQLNSLLDSNGNLIEIGPERLEESNTYIFPPAGIAEELCSKIVIIKK